MLQEEIQMMPRIGDQAPDFEAVTTTGRIKFSEFAKENGPFCFPTQQILLLYVQQK